MKFISSFDLKIILEEVDKILEEPDPVNTFWSWCLEGLVWDRRFNHGDETPVITLLVHLLKDWDKFSGNSQYPVPDPLGGDPELAEKASLISDPPYYWDKNTPYGKLVHESHLFVRDRLQHLVNSGEFIIMKDNGDVLDGYVKAAEQNSALPGVIR